MRLNKHANRGFGVITHPTYEDTSRESRLVTRSSIIGDDDDSFDRPGSSYLWIGTDHLLDKKEVFELVEHLVSWITTGEFKPENEDRDD